MSNNEIIRVIFLTVDNINQMQPKDKQIEKSPDTYLFGRLGKLDSLGLVNLIIELEQNIHDEFGIQVSLAEDETNFQDNSPFETIASLVYYVSSIIERVE